VKRIVAESLRILGIAKNSSFLKNVLEVPALNNGPPRRILIYYIALRSTVKHISYFVARTNEWSSDDRSQRLWGKT
jgi:hypothetical protein